MVLNRQIQCFFKNKLCFVLHMVIFKLSVQFSGTSWNVLNVYYTNGKQLVWLVLAFVSIYVWPRLKIVSNIIFYAKLGFLYT